MIPKIIHYCWFGRGKKSKLAKKCIESWKRYFPDYQIIEWNEDNFDVNKYEYTKYMYDNNKYAFLSDFVRLQVVYENGGIYFDTDVEVIKPLYEIVEKGAFFGFENDEFVNSGLGFGAEKGNNIVKIMLKEYSYFPKSFEEEKGPIGCPELNTRGLSKCGLVKNGKLQQMQGVTVYPKEYFNPYDNIINKLDITENTYTIHWYSGSWVSKRQKLRTFLLYPVHRLLGRNAFKNLKKFINRFYNRHF